MTKSKVLLLISIHSVIVFFTISSIIGYKYEGISESPIYLIYVILIFLLVFIQLIKVISKYKRIDKPILIVGLIVLFLGTNFIISILVYGYFRSLSGNYLIYFILYALPAMIAAYLVSLKHKITDLYKYYFIFMIIVTIGIFRVVINLFLDGSLGISYGGATYQTLSYISAFSFGLNLYFLNNSKGRKQLRNLFYIPMLIVQLLGVLLSGGRGGIILVFVYLIYTLFFDNFRTFKKTTKTLLLFLMISFTLYLFFPNLINSVISSSSFTRVFEFIGNNFTINWEGTSNRNIIYVEALDMIAKQPIFGYGIFGIWYTTGYPHNFLLELALGGGIVYLLVFIFFFLKVLVIVLKLARKFDKLFIYLFIYPFIQLMFSGTYLTNTEFWFVIMYAIIINNNKNNLTSKVEVYNGRKNITYNS